MRFVIFFPHSVSHNAALDALKADGTTPSQSGEVPPSSTVILDARTVEEGTRTIRMRNVVLHILHDILCMHVSFIDKFSATITNRWPLLFFAPSIHPVSVLLTARILMRTLVTMGPGYIQKFRVASEGFLVLNKLLPHYWYLPQLEEALVIGMLGYDIAQYPLAPFDVQTLRKFIVESQSRFVIPDLLQVIVSLWKQGAQVQQDLVSLEDEGAGKLKKKN